MQTNNILLLLSFCIFIFAQEQRTVLTIAGNGTKGFIDNVLAPFAQFNEPQFFSIDTSKNIIYVVDFRNNRIRAIDKNTNMVTTVAGTSQQRQSLGDGGPARFASFESLQNVVVDSVNDCLYVADRSRIRVIDRKTGIISSFAGNGTHGYSGDSGLAIYAMLNDPIGIAVDAASKLVFIADSGNRRIRVVHVETRIITTIAGNGNQIDAGDGLNALLASFGFLVNIALNSEYILVTGFARIRKIDRKTNIVSTIAGTGEEGYNGDGKALETQLRWVTTINIDEKHGRIYFNDHANGRIRYYDNLTGRVYTIGGATLNESLIIVKDGNFAMTGAIYAMSSAIDTDRGLIYFNDWYYHSIRAIFFCSKGYFSEPGYKCQKCGAGSFGPYPAMDSCEACQVGSASTTVGAFSNSTCSKCMAGTFSDTRGSTKCNPCDRNFFTNEEGSIQCKPCEGNNISDGGARECKPYVPIMNNTNTIIAVIAVIGAGIIVLVVATLITILVIRVIKRKASIERASLMTNEDFPSKEDELVDVLSEQETPSIEVPASSSWREFKYKELHFEEKLGSGGFATVRKALWHDIPVAVKELHSMDQVTPEMIDEFKHELSILCSLKFPKLVLLLGACTERNNLCLVMEYMNKGSLYQLLHVQKKKLSDRDICRLLSDMLQGLQFLHASQIIHRDLKSPNILLTGDAELQAKIADFGLAKTIANSHAHSNAKGTFYWMAPEVLCSNSYDFAADIWSIGLILYEMLTNQLPYHNEQWCKSVQSNPVLLMTSFQSHVGKHGNKPEWPTNVECNAFFKQIVHDCLHLEYKLRPNCKQLLSKLQAYAKEMQW